MGKSAGSFQMWMKLRKHDNMSVLAVHHIHTRQAGAALHSVRFLSITQPADVEAQRFDIINTLGHHQILMHQVAVVRARLGKNNGS